MSQIQLLGKSQFVQLIESARKSERKRANINLHPTFEDPLQRLVMAMDFDSYVIPHRHSHPAKSECFIVLRGSVGMAIFDDDGVVTQYLRLGPDEENQICDIPPGVIHTVIALSKDTVFMEAKVGPYTPMVEADIPVWSPKPGSQQAIDLVDALRSRFECGA